MHLITLVSFALLMACRREMPAPRVTHPNGSRAQQAPESWNPPRPSWVRLAPHAAPAQLAFFEGVTNGLSQVDIDPTLTPSVHPVPDRTRAAARFLRDHLPRQMRWSTEIRDGANLVAEGVLPVTTPDAIELSNELSQATNPYYEYDGVHDRIVYTELGPSELLVRANLVYALAERAHLHDLARLASVTPTTYALTLRVCDNLHSEFKIVTHLQAMEAMSAWVSVDPNLAPDNVFSRLNGRFIQPVDHWGIYPSLRLLTEDSQTLAARRREVMAQTLTRLQMFYPARPGELCSRYVISRGPWRGQYLLPSDDLPDILPYLEQVPALLAAPSAPSR